MKKEEQLLHALGNVKDSYILEPSRYLGNPQRFMTHQKKKKWPAFAAMAASAALLVAGALYFTLLAGKPDQTDIAPAATTQTEQNQYNQAEALTLPEGWPSFQMDYDSTELELVQGVDGLILCPIVYSEELPVCEIKIEFLPNLLPYAAVERSRKEMASDTTAVHQDQETLRYSFHIADGSVWDSHMADVYIVGAGSAGSYRLTSKYFMEAAEGWGITFAEICGSFTCTLEESPNPEAEKVIMDFAEGYFSGNQITMLSNYYGDSSNLRDTYTGDASRVQIVSLQGLGELDNWLDNWIEKDGFAHVSLAFLETEQSDSYTYLSMEVMKTQAGYRVSSYGLEK